MDTRLLRSFLSVVRTGSITAAAAELAYVQSTVTTHVQALERLAGTRLIDRLPAGTVPTPAGALLVSRAQQILDLEDRMLTEFGSGDRHPAGPVRLYAPESVCAYRLPPVLHSLRERFPDVRLSLVPGSTRTALSAVVNRGADLAMVVEPSVGTQPLDVVDLGPQRLSLIAPADTALPRRRPITPLELVTARTLLLEEGCSYSDELAALLAVVAPTETMPRFGSVETVKRCVEAGVGLALLPTVTVAAELSDGLLVELRPPAISRQHLWLVCPAGQWLPPAVRAVRELLMA